MIFCTFDKAVIKNSDAHTLFLSDKDFHTIRTFHEELGSAGIIQSMSRAAKCIDSGPLKGFRKILKSKHYYGRRFSSRKTLVSKSTTSFPDKQIDAGIEYISYILP